VFGGRVQGRGQATPGRGGDGQLVRKCGLVGLIGGRKKKKTSKISSAYKKNGR